MSPSRNGNAGVDLEKHLKGLRVAELRDVHAFWLPDEDAAARKKPVLVGDLLESMSSEGMVYRRVRTLTRKVLDVLLHLLRRNGYASDLPGLFQRLPGEEPLGLEYHEAEAGVKALLRRGFLAELDDRSMAGNGRVVYAVPQELGGMLTSLFREETRSVASVFTLAGHLAAITAAERARLQGRFPALDDEPGDADVEAILGAEGGPALLEGLPEPLHAVVAHALEQHGGLMTRAQWSKRETLEDVRWNREGWAPELEAAGVGTMARLALDAYGIAGEDEALVVFREVMEDVVARRPFDDAAVDEVLRPGGDLVADLCAFLEHVRRNPVRISRGGDVHKTSRRRIQEGFVFTESFLAGREEVWGEVFGAVQTLHLAEPDDERFLELTAEADRFLRQPLETKAHELYTLAVEQPGPRGKSLHQREMRTIVAELLREEPSRWWTPRRLAAVARHRYLASLDERGIEERHRDRFFSAYFSQRETPQDLYAAMRSHWFPRLHRLGLLDAAVADERVRAWRLSTLGARVLGAEGATLETGLRPLLVNPDFEVLVLPEGDVSDVVHTLDGYAQRVKSGDVVHFRFTKEAIESAVAAGRSVEDLLAFLEARSRGTVPQNVAYSLKDWAGRVVFARLERGVVIRVGSEDALERILAVDGMGDLVMRRLAPTEALLREEPRDRRLLAALRDEGVLLQGP